MGEWPGRNRRQPSIAEPARLVLRPLARGIAGAVDRHLAPSGRSLAVLDVGCGVKPYFPLLAPYADEYIGVDVEPGPEVDVVSPAEDLPFPNRRFDVVLCTQTLEHVEAPARVLGEIDRVLRPGGLVLLSTHGTAVYHPHPLDLWRWTQDGLTKLFEANGRWAELELEPAGGTAACFGYLVGFYVAAALGARALTPLRKTATTLINLLFAALDRVVPLHYPRRHTLIANFLVVARKQKG
jgi:SAM-dependent methyltransferase